MSGPCCLKDKDRCVFVYTRRYISICRESLILTAVYAFFPHARLRVAMFVPQLTKLIRPHLNKVHSALHLPSCLSVSVILRCPTRVSDMRMLDAETRFPPATPCYSGPVCAINSNPDVCHHRHPALPRLSLSSIFSASSRHPCSAASADEEVISDLLCIYVATLSWPSVVSAVCIFPKHLPLRSEWIKNSSCCSGRAGLPGNTARGRC